MEAIPRSPRLVNKQVANGIPLNDRARDDLVTFRDPARTEFGTNVIKAVQFILVKAAVAIDIALLDHPWPSDYLRSIRVKGQLIPVASRHPEACYTSQGDVLLPVQEGDTDCTLYCMVNARIGNLVNAADVPGNNFCILCIPLREMATLSGLTFLAPHPNCPPSVTESFEFVTRRSFPNLAARPALPPPPANGPREFVGLPFKGFIALAGSEIPFEAQDPDAMAMAYAAEAPHFLGAGHPDWRRLADAPITWFYSLGPVMMAAAQVAAITEHQLESFREWMANAEAHGGLDGGRLAEFGLELRDRFDNIFGNMLNAVPLLGNVAVDDEAVEDPMLVGGWPVDLDEILANVPGADIDVLGPDPLDPVPRLHLADPLMGHEQDSGEEEMYNFE